MTAKLITIVRRMAYFALAAYTLVGALLYIFQRDMMYMPEQREYVHPSHYDMLTGVQEIRIPVSKDLELLAWYAPAPAEKPTVLIFHGNGGSLRGLRYRLAHMRDAGLGVLLLAYRGYSGNKGQPTEKGLYEDARAAIAWLNRNAVSNKAIVLYGESLGTGVATKMAAEQDFKAVVLESPYTSTVSVAEQRFPLFPAGWLMADRFDSLARIGHVTEPLLIMHGDVDQVIPQAMGKQLYAAANEPKQGFWPVGAGHGDIFDKGGLEQAVAFIESVGTD